MNIALLTEKYTPDIGGLAISSERFARLLASAGHNVRVFSPSSNLLPSEKRTLISNGINLTRFGIQNRIDDTLVDWFELIAEEHKRDPFDVLHAYYLPKAGFVAVYAGKFMNVPSVVSIRGNDIERSAFDPSRFSHVMYTLQNASSVTTNASELSKKAKAFIDREIHLIPNGIDINLFKPLEKNIVLAETLNLTHNDIPGKARNLSSLREDASVALLPQSDIVPVIGFVGELRNKKGMETLLPAYAQVNKKHPSTLLIVGEVRQGDDRKTFSDFQLSHPDAKIVVTGYISHRDLPAYYSLFDVFVHPSLRDGMPNAILEAMACEKAVIATPVGGVKDILEDKKNGITVNVNDENMLAEKIIELLGNQEKRRIIGANARKTIINKFTLEIELQANTNIYQTLGIKI